MPGVAKERHVAIIGGGMIGSSSLFYLAQQAAKQASAQKHSSSNPAPTLRLTLIEESASVAPAASGKSGGFLAEDWHGADTADLGRLSFRLHRELAEQQGGREKWGYRGVGTYSLNFDDRDNKKGKSKCPKEIDWIDGQHVTSSSNMAGTGTTAQVTPLALVQHLVRQAQQDDKNVEVMTNTRAERVDIDQQSGHINALYVKNKQDGTETKLDVDDVIVAAGPWTGQLIKSLLPRGAPSPSFLRNASRITGSRAHSVVIQSPKQTSAHCLFTDMHYGKKAGAPEVYCREDGTIYACGGSDSVPLPASADLVEYDAKQTATLIDQMRHLSPSHLTTEAGAKITREQACYLPVSSRGPTIAGDHSLGLYVAAGHSCWGITLGLGTGKVVSELVMGQKPSADISALG